MNKFEANNLWKARFGVTIPEAVERFNKKYEGMKMSTAAKKLNFDWDNQTLPAWASNDMPNVLTDLVATSNFLGEVNIMEGVKGTAEITFMEVDFALQKVTGCSLSPDGDVIFTGDDISTVLLGSAIEFCNEGLNGKVTQILNSLGVKGQDDHIPYDIEDILMAYVLKVAQKKLQDLVFLGNTNGGDPDLVHFDGLLKLWANDGNIPTVPFTGTFKDNAYAIALELAYSAEGELIDNDVPTAILMSPSNAIAVLRDYNARNPYNQVELPAKGTGINLPIPNTQFTIMGISQFRDAYADAAFLVPLSYVTFATDEMEDMQWDIKYDEYNNKLKIEMKYRAGIQYSFPQYFRKLNLTPPVAVTAGDATYNATAGEGTSGDTYASVFTLGTVAGGAANANNATISSTPTTELSIDPVTGDVILAPLTGAGTYTITYGLCEIANPSNCATGTITVIVGS